MPDKLEWKAIHEMSLGPLRDYEDDWKSTIKKIKSHNDDIEETVLPGLKKVFDFENTPFSKGGEAAVAHVKSLAGELEDAQTEGEAVKKIVADAIEEFKPLRNAFRDKVEEVESTSGPLDTDGNYSVDLANCKVKGPREPDLSEWKDIEKHGINKPSGGWDSADSPLSVWRGVVDAKIREFTDALDTIAEDAAEVDDEATALLNGASANVTNGFNGKADEDVEQASIEEQEKDAEEVADRLGDGEVTQDDIEYANEKMKEHKGEDHFAGTMMKEIGAKGLAELTGDVTGQVDNGNMDEDVANTFYKGMGKNLATATDPDNSGYVGDKWVDKFMEMGGGYTETSEGAMGHVTETTYIGYEQVAPLFEHGEYDSRFIVPVAEHVMGLHNQEVFDIEGGEGLPDHFAPNSVLKALENNPDAATDFFSKDPKYDHESYPDLDEEYLPKDNMDYVLDHAGSESTDYLTDDGYDPGINVKVAGAALESACTGMPSDGDGGKVPPEHSKEMIAVTERLVERLGTGGEGSTDPADDLFSGGRLHGMAGNVGDVLANYMPDIYNAFSPGEEYESMINGDKAAFGEGMKSELENVLYGVGSDPEANGVVTGAALNTMGVTLDGYPPEDAGDNVATTFGSITGFSDRGLADAAATGVMDPAEAQIKQLEGLKSGANFAAGTILAAGGAAAGSALAFETAGALAGEAATKSAVGLGISEAINSLVDGQIADIKSEAESEAGEARDEVQDERYDFLEESVEVSLKEAGLEEAVLADALSAWKNGYDIANPPQR